MNQSVSSKLIHILAIVIAVVIILLPFHALLTVWLSSLVGHYTLLRLWKEILLVVAGLITLILLARDKLMRQALYASPRLFWSVIIYLALMLALGLTAYAHHNVSGKALAYGLLEDSRYLLFLGLCLAIATRDKWLKKVWPYLVLGPAAVVILFGLLQAFVLPYNFLAHLGYGSSTIPAYATVNSSLHFIRVQSTLRGANPLGAYLILVLAVIAVELKLVRSNFHKLALGLMGLASLVVLYFTYSRSAWLGAGVALAAIAISLVQSARLRQGLVAGGLGVVLIAAGGVLLLRHNNRFENIVFHTSPHSVPTTSDQNHQTALEQGLHDLIKHPLGLGPGTAGPASVYNRYGGANIAENYFVQIGQEIGWLGLALFILINIIVGFSLWQNSADPLALALWTSLIGISIVGMLSHVWSDDTLSYMWWGLAGIGLSRSLKRAKLSKAV